MPKEQLVQSVGYCRCSVFKCPNESLHHTKRAIIDSDLVIVPSDGYNAAFLHFFGRDKRVFTPIEFLRFLSINAFGSNELLSASFAKILFKENVVADDASAYLSLFTSNNFDASFSKDDLEKINRWMQFNNLCLPEKVFNFLKNEHNIVFEKVVLYGNFEKIVLEHFVPLLKKIFRFIDIITHTPAELEFLKEASNELIFFNEGLDKNISTIQQCDYFIDEIMTIKEHIASATVESIAVIEMHNNALAAALRAVISVEQRSIDNSSREVFNSFFKWMYSKDFVAFINFLHKLDEFGFRKFDCEIANELINAFNRCLTSDYSILWHYLISEKNISSLKEFPPVFFSEIGNFSFFYSATKGILGKFFQEFFSKNACLETLEINVSREDFVASIQSILCENSPSPILQHSPFVAICDLKIANSFPFKTIMLPFFNKRIWPHINKNCKSVAEQKVFIDKILTLNTDVRISFSKKSENGEMLDASDLYSNFLANASAQINENKSCAHDFNVCNQQFIVKHKLCEIWNKNLLTLPHECLDFSCKTWERFKLAPLQTFFEKIINVKSQNSFFIDAIKNKRIGELSHDWVAFGRQSKPKSAKIWLATIFEKYASECEFLKNVYSMASAPLYTLTQQSMNKALSAAIMFAKSSAEFLCENLKSEYALKKSRKIMYSGRIDLLVTHASESKKLTVVDFKNSKNLTLSTSQLLDGHGLQLFLYGYQLKLLGAEDVNIKIFTSDGYVTSCSFDSIYEKTPQIIDWVHETHTTGMYKGIPKEDREFLPIACNL